MIGLASDLAWCRGRGLVKEKAIAPHIPVFDRSRRDDGTLSRADFTFDAEHNVYVCPQGKWLRTTGRVHDGRTLLYRSQKVECDLCPLKLKCCPNTPHRKIPPRHQ
jgi:hypothetical protein